MRTSTPLRVVLAALAIFVSLIVAVPAASALTFHNVTTTADVVNPADGVLSLREAVDLANSDGDHSVINLAAGQLYELDLCQMKEPIDNGGGFFFPPPDDDANADGDLDHTAPHNLTINGNGSTISQTCDHDRVIHSMSDATHLVIDDTTIRGGNWAPEPGDNIRSLGSLTLADNTVVRDGKDWNGGGYAIAVGDSGNYDPGIWFTVSNSSIIDNQEAGARHHYGLVTVTGATVTGQDGTGLLVSFGSMNVTNSTVSNNVGGGLSGIDSGVTVTNSTVAGNLKGVAATGNTPGMSPIVITGSTIDNNSEGGVSCSYCETVAVQGSSITNNGSTGGPGGSFGGISMFTYLANPGITVFDSTLSGNRTPDDGGAIDAFFDDQGFGPAGHLPTIEIVNSDLFDNRSGILSDGGAVHVEEAHVTVTEGTTFTNNWAKPSNALYGGDGGAIAMGDGGLLTIDDASFTDNRAQGDGGAIRAFGIDGAHIVDAEFVTNHALGGGGGGMDLFNANSVEIVDTSVLENSADIAGGGIRFGSWEEEHYHVDIDGSTVAGNITESSIIGGGGIFANGALGSMDITNSTVTDNQAGGPGAGIEILGDGAIYLGHVTMAFNESTSGQEANLFHQNGPLTSYASIIGAGLGGGPDCGTFSGATNSQGYNRLGDKSCGLNAATDDVVATFGLGPLANNGGPTPTRKPHGNATVVNIIPVAQCDFAVDQRNVARPVGAKCDAGAVEVAGRGSGPDDLAPPEKPRFPPKKRRPRITAPLSVDVSVVADAKPVLVVEAP